MIEFIKKYKTQIIKLSLFIVCLIALSLIVLGILFVSKVIYFEDGFQFNKEIFNALGNNFVIYIVFILLQVLVTTLLTFAPGTTMMFIALGLSLFGANWKCFLICYIGVILSSLTMDLIGRFGGSTIIKKLIGEKEYESALKLVSNRGTFYLPIMYLLPVFPDDALCMIAGMIKIKFYIHAIFIVLFRGIGIATIIFGINLIPFETFTRPYDYIVFGAVMIVYIYVLFSIAHKVEKIFNKNKKTDD